MTRAAESAEAVVRSGPVAAGVVVMTLGKADFGQVELGQALQPGIVQLSGQGQAGLQVVAGGVQAVLLAVKLSELGGTRRAG